MTTIKTTLLATILALGAVACGDDKKAPDAFQTIDAPSPDASPNPAAPHLGIQIDRMGRPAINTALNHVLDADANTKTMAKDMYNADQGPATWPGTYSPEFAKNLAIFDALDKGAFPSTTGAVFHCSITTTTVCSDDGGCPSGETCVGQACGDQVLYNGQPAGHGAPAQCFNSSMQYQSTCSYNTLAGILADDQLYLDTTKPRCQAYLAVEFAAVSGQPNTDCGGRAPDNDVMDSSYSVLAAGLNGFDLLADPPAPKVKDNVSAHTDLKTDFPFLGDPH